MAVPAWSGDAVGSGAAFAQGLAEQLTIEQGGVFQHAGDGQGQGAYARFMASGTRTAAEAADAWGALQVAGGGVAPDGVV